MAEHTRHDGSQHDDATRQIDTGQAARRESTAPIRTEGTTVSRGTPRDAVAAQRAVFGGIKWGAAFFGWLSANGLAVLLVALLSAAGVALGLAQGVDTADEAAAQVETLGIGSGIAILVVLFLAYLAGGYVAGRMSRFDGARQGVAVWLIGLVVVLVLAAAGAILGAQYNVLQQLNLPRIPIDEGTATTAAMVTLVAILLVTLLGALLGGTLGERYHRTIDRAGVDA
ncbi:hypothetical protein FHU33_1619 [Blastococcus colisei]|uniref:Major facilitator superfamily (MFS) profile domain-containing protein n=1 Tax=Blastococcus colisei TaxID=1564162 RepID=A0A543PDR0_9ACTN|nr:hypothetical protein [Blastococcus colisei]TQN42224.1 hypothetical protein FHU33_1619 [Blastococcus colisei]